MGGTVNRNSLVFGILASLPVLGASLAPAGLRCEYRTNPLGIDVAQPRLSWTVKSTAEKARGLKQTAYRIVVSSSAEALARGAGDLWDTGKVASGESAQIVYKGKVLGSGVRAWWRVKVWDGTGAESAWSETADWSMGLLQTRDWKGRWIGLDEKQQPANHVLPARMLRKEFEAASKPKRATVYVSGLGSSELYMNGSKVGDDVLSPGLTDYSKRVLYVTHDVTDRVTAGRNAIGLMLGCGRFFGPLNSTVYGYPKALLQLEIEYADGSKARVVTDGTWKLTANGPIRGNNEYEGEEYDARSEMNGWATAGFDDSGWHAANEVQAPPGVLRAQMAEPLRVMETIRPVKVTPGANGTYIVDMGQNLVGWCRLRVNGPAGTKVTLRHAESLKSDGTLYVANLRTAKATDTYTLKGGGVEAWEPRFTYHGFRYVEVSGFPGAPSLDALEGRVVHDAMPRAGTFESSSDMLNRIYHNIFWGVRGNYRSIPTDCPQRDERQGWLGDRSQVSHSEAYLFDVAAFYSKWMADLSDSQWPNGSIPDVSPNYWVIYSENVTWPSTYLFLPGLLYDHYGDRRVIEQYYPGLKRWLDHMATYTKNGLIAKDTYGDWCVPPESPTLIHSQDPARRTDGTLISTAYYIELLKLMARYARLIDKPAEAKDFETQATVMTKAFQAKFYRPDKAIYDNGTQTSSVLALAFGLAPKEDREAILAGLVRKIVKESDSHVGVGLVGAQWLMRTLSDNGHSDIAYTMATQKTYPGWGYMVEKGATTVWELWNGDTADPAMNSMNHVMQIGDLGVWMYEYLAGIRPDPEKPAFKHVIVRPFLTGDLAFVKASHESMYGTIASSWERKDGSLRLSITIPANTTATVYVPARDAAQVRESGKPAAQSKDLKFVRMEGTNAVYEIGSGSYAFEASL